MKGLHVRPTTLRKANDFVAENHRHNGRTSRNGGRFAVSLWWFNQQVGVAIVGNPISATFMDGVTAEVLRTCTLFNAPKGSVSCLYGACWRAWRAMGGRRMLTYTLQSESGASLRGAGWEMVSEVRPTGPGWRKNDHLQREHQAVMFEPKYRWEVAVPGFTDLAEVFTDSPGAS